MPKVVQVHMVSSDDHGHEHIEGVCDSTTYYTRLRVVQGIRSGERWYTDVGGKEADIHIVDRCRHCTLTPYISTDPDWSKANNLDNLPRCRPAAP